MKKKILKYIREAMSKTSIKIVFYIVALTVVLFIYGVFADISGIKDKIFGIIESESTVSVFFAGLVALILAEFIKWLEYYLEESSKISDNHHDIILKYSGHEQSTEEIEADRAEKGNLCYDKGVFLELQSHHVKVEKNIRIKNSEKDEYSGNFKKVERAIKRYKEQHILRLPSINMFTNKNGKTELFFEDRDEMHKLPDFIIDNGMELMAAHKNSSSKNNNTIRLDDFTYKNNKLCFQTRRSTYYYMLMTNRCMDYNFGEGFTLRKLYEYGNTIRRLSKSLFSNQIGINGLVLTSDGYVLIEKRDHKKTTWKDKFAQSISLAMKESDFKFDTSSNFNVADKAYSSPTFVMENSYSYANDKLGEILYRTLKDNFGLERGDLEPIDIKTNFLGLARDLLEGGKPNIYFYVVTTCNAKELAEKMKNYAGKPEGAVLKTEKLSSDYYLVPYGNLKIDYDYAMELDRTKCIRIRRNVHPRVKKSKDFKERFCHKMSGWFSKSYVKECGEALLVTLAYLELCEERIPVLKQKK